MVNYCKKPYLFLFVLSLCNISSMDAMVKEVVNFFPETFFGYSYTRQNSLDKELWSALRASIYSERDFKQIEECLHKGANPNVKSNGETSLTWAISIGNAALLEFLIQQGADINLKNTYKSAPLIYSIFYYKLNANIARILCNSGALLVNIAYIPGANAFHYAVKVGESEGKELIQILMTHARFDSYDQDKEQKKRKLLATLSVLSKLPQEIRFFILEKLVLVDDVYLNTKNLCEKLVSEGYNGPILAQVNKRVKNIKKILTSEDDKYELTASEWVVNFNHAFSSQSKKEIQALLDEKRLEEHWNNFNAEFPKILELEPNNPVCIMFSNCEKLLEEKK